MPLAVNLRHLDNHNLHLKGELPLEELDLDTRDEMVRASRSLDYDLEVQKLDESLLVRGNLHLPLDCQCVRCLKGFRYNLEVVDWTLHLPLTGEESAPVINDCVDLTPYLREDILLSLPQHPLCKQECRGLENHPAGKKKKARPDRLSSESSDWAELDKLKL